MENMDIYDQHIAELAEHPDRIEDDWMGGTRLFKLLGNTHSSGCITMIRNAPNTWSVTINEVPNYSLTSEIANDSRLPSLPQDVTLEHLPLFAEYQRRFDALVLEASKK